MRLVVIDLDAIEAERERIDKILFHPVRGLVGKHMDNTKVARLAALRWVAEQSKAISPHIDEAFTAGYKLAMKHYKIDYKDQDTPSIKEYKRQKGYEEEHLKQPT